MALSIETDRITLFDQNNPCYFQVVDRTSSDDLAPVLFNALLPPLDCNASISGDYAQVQCGNFRSRLPSDPERSWDINNHSFLKAFQAYAVFTIQAVLPANSSRKVVSGTDEQLEWLSDQQFNRVPDVNTADARGVTRLHLASRAGNQISVAEQLREKVWHSPVTEAGQTPLSMARVKGQQKVMQLLQAEGAIETPGYLDSDPSTLLYQRYSQPQVHPEPQIYQPDYRHPVSERLPGQNFEQHCQSGCSTGIDGSDGLGGYRFRKAIAAIGRGEDPVSQGIERTVQGMVKISYEHFPEETQKVLNGLTASGEAVDAVVDFADKATGRVVSKKWNSLDQVTRDELAGYGKIFSVIAPPAKVRSLMSLDQLSGKHWSFNPKKDVDFRGTGKSFKDGLEEAFKRTGIPRENFKVTQWGKDINGKSIPTEYTSSNGASVNVDIPEWNNIRSDGTLGAGPHQPHIGYQTPGRGKERIRGHIFIDNIPATRR
ncbi:hypothetical protein GZ78_17585 [Endozoicomonas numazuensis]|uniref:Bacterial toxin 47 domain-containing protein n=1 Tax=Endozoicomonas numazuensis TaxID=1137799 RepID=A0A081NGI3_9GAMM|nr:hypothetical protein GZ78_17585 [Endozoicomonas numazuensis]